jgi:hypothetical protein
MQFDTLFKRIKEIQSGNIQGSKRIIDIETLETYRTLRECGEKIGCSGENIYQAILNRRKVKGHRFEYLEEWQYWTDKEKEKHTRKNNIYFLKGDKI